MDIETKQASLDTLAVTIQALHVNGKQMTLAVFRQLPRAMTQDMIDPTVQLWGFVNYYMPDEMIRRWIVFSANGLLFRAGFDELWNLKVGTDQSQIMKLSQLFIAV